MALKIGSTDFTFGNIVCNGVDIIKVNVVANGTTQTIWQNYLTYTLLNDNTYSVKATNKDILPSTIIIPSTFNSRAVTQIDSDAFSGCDQIISVIIPTNVTTIGINAFKACSNLTTVSLPDSLISIKSSAFEACTALTSVTIPKNVTELALHAFYQCTALKTVSLPTSLTTIGDRAFYWCTELTTLNMPSSVTSIGTQAFWNCEKLNNITIPSSITSISLGAFGFCAALTRINIPSAVTAIGESAFYGCTALTSIVIPTSVTSISDLAFGQCSALTIYSKTAAKPEGWIATTDDNWNPNNRPVYWLGNFTYTTAGAVSAKDTNITGNLVIPRIIPKEAFTSPPAEDIVVTQVGGFSNCVNLESLVIPDSVTSIEDSYAFQECTSLKLVTFGSGLTSLGYGAFYNCTKLSSVVLPEGMLTIGEVAFSGCSALSTVSLPNSITTITKGAFTGCSALRSITLPNALTTLERNVFQNCYALGEVVMPKNLKTIDTLAFSNCNAIRLIHYDGRYETWKAISGYDSTALTKALIHHKGYAGTELIDFYYIPAGTYVFNKTLNCASDVYTWINQGGSFALSFESNGVQYNSINTATARYICYGAPNQIVYDTQTDSWTTNQYRTIKITEGTSKNGVSHAPWFIDNTHITFTVRDKTTENVIEYYAEDGMTWTAWATSTRRPIYNPDGFYTEGGTNQVKTASGKVIQYGSSAVKSTSTIEAGREYYFNS